MQHSCYVIAILVLAKLFKYLESMQVCNKTLVVSCKYASVTELRIVIKQQRCMIAYTGHVHLEKYDSENRLLANINSIYSSAGIASMPCFNKQTRSQGTPFFSGSGKILTEKCKYVEQSKLTYVAI